MWEGVRKEGRKNPNRGTQEFIWLLKIVQKNDGGLHRETLGALDPEPC